MLEGEGKVVKAVGVASCQGELRDDRLMRSMTSLIPLCDVAECEEQDGHGITVPA
jgi:hypothetical protein